MPISHYFSDSYFTAREKFRTAATKVGAEHRAFYNPYAMGAQGEELSTDLAILGQSDPQRVVLVTSAMHGVEGFCGSGCQIALLDDSELLERLNTTKTALVLVHAINPYGFSHVRRVNENNIDLNRNFLDFSAPLPPNASYEEIHPLLIPEHWPPNTENRKSVDDYIETRSLKTFQAAVTIGQNQFKDGLFYSGVAPAWSNSMLREILCTYIAPHKAAAWIDIHTGLGPSGHGEKICAGKNEPSELQRAKRCWGADVVSPYNGDSASAAIQGSGSSSIPTECPNTISSVMALEFGTQPVLEVLGSLRADQWLVNNLANGKTIDTQTTRAIKQRVKNAFYTETAAWQGAVTSQTRVAVLQAIAALNNDWY